MVTPLLKAKLFVPLPRPDLVPRPRLVQRLDAGIQTGCLLTLISAPAGFGKTTLLSEWASVCGRPVAWLSLDEGDNDPARFLAYLVGALQSVQEDFGVDVLAALQSPQPPSMETVLTALVNELATVPQPFLVVLDDYHLIESPPVQEKVAFMLDHLPPQAHVAIATRTDPPLQLSLLRGRRQLTELREADLRFTPVEATSFLTQISGLVLRAEDVAALEERTEGWVTGLQLAALSMQGRDDVSSFIEAFAGSNRYVIDYLTEEVLQRQPTEIQTFLLETAVLDRLSGSLCDAVTGRDDGAPMLAALEKANLFLVPLDDQRRWFRYHRLFRDLLRARIEEAQPEQVPDLHRRASSWHEKEGGIDAAVKHAAAGGDLTRVSALIETHGIGLLLRGELTTLLRWMSALPEEMVSSNPRICIWHAWALLLSGQLEQVEPRLQQAESHVSTAPVGDLQGHIAAIRAYLAAQWGDVERTIETAHRALELLDQGNPAIKGVVLFVLGGTYLLRGDMAAAGEAMTRAAAIGLEGGNVHIAAPALNALAGIKSQQGHLRRAQETSQQAIQVATGPSGRLLPMAAGPLSALAELAYEWNDLEAALAYAEQSIELGHRWGNRDSLAHGFLTMARILIGVGNLEGARDALREAEHLSRQPSPPPLLQIELRATSAYLSMAQGDLQEAGRWADQTPPKSADPVHAWESLVLARVRIALHQPEVALQILAPLLEMSREQGLRTMVIWALAIQAMAHHALEADDRAQVTLGEALTLAKPEGYIRLFTDLGPQMQSLLHTATQGDVTSEYTHRLMEAFESPGASPQVLGRRPGAPPAPAARSAAPLVEPLSPREVEVLSLVADGLSNREIAGRLFIAESTVKSHLNTVYQKLGVKNRTQAVGRARTLNLID